MPRKGKEPAGLRRWRLAHRKHRRVRRLKTRVVRYTARRRRGFRRKGRRGSKAIPAIQTAMIAYPLFNAYKQTGLTTAFPEKALFELTGYSANTGKMIDPAKPIALFVGLLIATKLGGPLASKCGANRLLKKISGGMVKLA